MSTALTAVNLLGRWTRLSGRHVALASGCSCGAAPASLRLQDHEQQILDYLRARHGEIVGASMVELLRALSGRTDRAAKALLGDLARSLDSFEELHRISPGAGSSRPG
ncbi:MAG TPA: hypothetical protein VFI86_10375 [Burkholderiales bacterium]|nr:hypothetical protein [Burkholderiales bacterium]